MTRPTPPSACAACLAGVAACLAGVAACSATDVNLGGDNQIAAVIAPSPSRDLDVLFVIDSSISMGAEQDGLAARLKSALFDAVTFGDDGEPLNLHVGVITTSVVADMPPGACGPAGIADDGKLWGGGCVDGNYLIDVQPAGEPERQVNYPGTFDEALGCLVRVGVDGCGLERPFDALTLALARPEQAEFFRPQANLLVVIVTDEDDCSAREPARFYSPGDSQYGPLDSFRCVLGGVVCDEPLDTLGEKTHCRAVDDGPLQPVATVAAALVAAKGDPAKVLVTVIAGDTAPFSVVQFDNLQGVARLDAKSCGLDLEDSLAGAAPPVRLAALADAFPGRAQLASICEPLSAALSATADLASDAVNARGCLRGALVDADPSSPGVQPACRAYEVVGGRRTELPTCGASPCLRVITDAACASGQRAEIERGSPSAEGAHVEIRCRMVREQE